MRQAAGWGAIPMPAHHAQQNRHRLSACQQMSAQRTDDRKDCLMDLRPALIADREPAKAIELGQRALHYPPMPSETLARFDAPTGEAWHNAPPATRSEERRVGKECRA